jgi:hypothetical protein
MNPFEILALVIGIIVIANILKTRRLARQSVDQGEDRPGNDELKQEIASLKDRIAVLERIATDEGRRLDREIEKLRDS